MIHTCKFYHYALAPFFKVLAARLRSTLKKVGLHSTPFINLIYSEIFLLDIGLVRYKGHVACSCRNSKKKVTESLLFYRNAATNHFFQFRSHQDCTSKPLSWLHLAMVDENRIGDQLWTEHKINLFNLLWKKHEWKKRLNKTQIWISFITSNE